jgi:hypothetical protein
VEDIAGYENVTFSDEDVTPLQDIALAYHTILEMVV